MEKPPYDREALENGLVNQDKGVAAIQKAIDENVQRILSNEEMNKQYAEWNDNARKEIVKLRETKEEWKRYIEDHKRYEAWQASQKAEKQAAAQ